MDKAEILQLGLCDPKPAFFPATAGAACTLGTETRPTNYNPEKECLGIALLFCSTKEDSDI